MCLNGLNLISQTYFFLLRLGAVILQDYIFLGESHKDQFLLQLFSPFICYRWGPFIGNIKYHSYHYADDTQIYLLLLRTTSCRSFQLCEYSYWILWHESKPVKYDFQTHDENKRIMLIDICNGRVISTRFFRSAWSPCTLLWICLCEIHT